MMVTERIARMVATFWFLGIGAIVGIVACFAWLCREIKAPDED